jgi:hypothetical protein
MSRLLHVLAVLAVAAIALAVSPPANAANDCPGAMQIAMHTPCVESRMSALEAPSFYKESCGMIDNGDRTMSVIFYYEPRCLDDPIPCRIATQAVFATVDCQTRTATCP